MSRTATRERQRRLRLEAELREAVNRARDADQRAAQLPPRPGGPPDHGELWKVLCAIDLAGLCVWELADDVGCTEDERAMIATVVERHLTWARPRFPPPPAR